MVRKLATLTVFSVSTLFLATIICADQAGLPDSVLPQTKSSDKLLIPLMVIKRQNVFEQDMTEAGWDIHKPDNLLFYNVRQIIARNEIMSLQSEIDKKITAEYHNSRALDSSA